MLWLVLNMTLGIYGEDESMVIVFQSLMGFPMRCDYAVHLSLIAANLVFLSIYALSRIDLISLKFR